MPSFVNFDPPFVVTTLFVVGAIVVFTVFGRISRRERQIHPMLVVAAAMLPLAWMESPGDWVFFAQYHPGFARVPDWGPLGLAHEGLPAMAIPAYPFFWVVPILGSIALAKRSTERRDITFAWRLLVIGFAVGFLWDAIFEITATRVGIWRFAYVPWGLSLFTESKYQMTFAVSIVCGMFAMVCAYLVGRTNDRGEDRIKAWARTKTTRHAGLLHLLAMAAFFQVAYALSMLPIYLVKVLDLSYYAAGEPLFGDIPNQTADATRSGPGGFATLVGGAAVLFLLTYLIVRHLERPKFTPASSEAPRKVVRSGAA